MTVCHRRAYQWSCIVRGILVVRLLEGLEALDLVQKLEYEGGEKGT